MYPLTHLSAKVKPDWAVNDLLCVYKRWQKTFQQFKTSAKWARNSKPEWHRQKSIREEETDLHLSTTSNRKKVHCTTCQSHFIPLLQRIYNLLVMYQMAETSLCAPSTSPTRDFIEAHSTASAASCRLRACRASTGEPGPWSWGTFLDTRSTSSLTPSSATCWSRTPLQPLILFPSGWPVDWQVNGFWSFDVLTDVWMRNVATDSGVKRPHWSIWGLKVLMLCFLLGWNWGQMNWSVFWL